MTYHHKLSTEEMVTLYKDGKTTAEIAKEYGYKNDHYIIAKLRNAGAFKKSRIDKGMM